MKSSIYPSKPSSEYIQTLFNELAPRYDFFNRLTIMGMDRVWRRETVKLIRPGMRVLDIGCGSGDLALLASHRAGPSGEVLGLDFSAKMLEVAKQRYQKLNNASKSPISFVCKGAEELPLNEPRFDAVISGFVLRNIYENIDPILRGVYDSLKEGGRVSLLDMTEPKNPLMRFIWRTYMNTLVRLYGYMIFGRKYPAEYLVDSAKRFLKQDEFIQKLKEHGFKNARARQFLFGNVCIYEAER